MRSSSPCVSGVLAVLLLGAAFSRLLAGGVTVMTHGFSGDVGTWIIPMADRVPGHPGFEGTQFSCYQVDITESGGQLGASATLLGGVHGDLPDSGEIFIKLDWSSEAGLFFGSSSTRVATAAVEALLSTSLIPELDGRALAELPLHLAGHSRGGSVVAEMARLLGAQGVWVDHLTLWDPVDNTFGDGTVFAWENVLFADNYWQDAVFPSGRSITGAYNRKLTSLGGGYGSAHSDAHLWYHGTVELGTPASDSQVTIGQSQRDTWWVSAENAGATAGFHYSLIGGGDRLSSLQPLGVGTDRISDGYNKAWDLGGGVTGNRTPLPVNAGTWPNVIRLLRTTTGDVTVGETFDLRFYHQSGPGATGDAELRAWLDPDLNAWNGNEVLVHQQLVTNTGTNAVTESLVSVLADPEVVAPGGYAVLATITEGGRTRSLHAPAGVLVLPHPYIDKTTFRREGGLVAFDVIGTTGQDVTLLASEDLVDWDPVGSMVFSGSTWEFTDADSGTIPRRFYVPVMTP